MSYVVYMHTNILNNKKYIGITSLDPKTRWANGKGYRFQMFGRAIEKYGWNNFKHEILFENLSQEEAQRKEIQLIKEYKTHNPDFGYNISFGGDLGIKGVYNLPSMSTPVHLYDLSGKYIASYPSTMEAERATGIDSSNIVSCCKGHHIYTKEYRWSYEKVDYLPFFDKDKYIYEVRIKDQEKTVYQYLLDGTYYTEYKSLTEASKKTNLSFKDISQVCLGDKVQTHGFYFSYEYLGSKISPKCGFSLREIKIILYDSEDCFLKIYNNLSEYIKDSPYGKSKIRKIIKSENNIIDNMKIYYLLVSGNNYFRIKYINNGFVVEQIYNVEF